MATIGMDKLYYAKITEDEKGIETYGTPVSLTKAISAGLSISLAEAVLYHGGDVQGHGAQHCQCAGW